jgi:Domain of unknown function (DUF4917)
MTFEEVIKKLNARKKGMHLLLGNGFSMAYDNNIFSYNALSDFVSNLDNDLLKRLFEIINTKNFELIMQQLDNFIELAKEFSSDEELESKITIASKLIKSSLLDAVKTLHPEHVFKVPEEKSISCSKFLNAFLNTTDSNVFTTNYDLLLYWVLMRNKNITANSNDGFGREIENDFGEYIPEDEVEWSELLWGSKKREQNMHYLHGALPLFDTGTKIIKEVYNGNYLLKQIENRIAKNDYPIFVTAGNGDDKLKHILHNQYLSFCYDKLCNIQGSLVTFGFNFGEYDDHIINAINIAAKNGKKVNDRLWSVYIGVYSEADERHINKIKHKFKCKINTYDAKTANIWGG